MSCLRRRKHSGPARKESDMSEYHTIGHIWQISTEHVVDQRNSDELIHRLLKYLDVIIQKFAYFFTKRLKIYLFFFSNNQCHKRNWDSRVEIGADLDQSQKLQNIYEEISTLLTCNDEISVGLSFKSVQLGPKSAIALAQFSA